jgi:hypothetical protein
MSVVLGNAQTPRCPAWFDSARRGDAIARAASLLCLAVAIGLGCAASGSIPDTATVPPEHGIFVVHVRNDLGPYTQLQIAKQSQLEKGPGAWRGYNASPAEALGIEEDGYWVRSLPAGEYFFAGVVSGNSNQVMFGFREVWKFKLEPGEVTYIGHVHIVSDHSNPFRARAVGLEVVDATPAAGAFLAQAYPRLTGGREPKASVAHRELEASLHAP